MLYSRTRTVSTKAATHQCTVDAPAGDCPRCNHNRELRSLPDVCACGHGKLEHHDGHMFCTWTSSGACSCNKYQRATLDYQPNPELHDTPKKTKQVERERDEPDLYAFILERRPRNKDNWIYRVKLSHKQAVIGYPHQGTIMIAFEHEDHLDLSVSYNQFTPELIYHHIQSNKGDDRIEDDTCVQAIQFIVEAAHHDIGQIREPA